MPLPSCESYVQRVLELFKAVPGTLGYVRPADRRLAVDLYQKNTPLDIIHAALLLAVARRTSRPDDQEPLAPIASLHYFKPIIQELLISSPDPAYIDYLRFRLADLAPRLATPIDHHLP
jgi:hypothetical protein